MFWRRALKNLFFFFFFVNIEKFCDFSQVIIFFAFLENPENKILVLFKH